MYQTPTQGYKTLITFYECMFAYMFVHAWNTNHMSYCYLLLQISDSPQMVCGAWSCHVAFFSCTHAWNRTLYHHSCRRLCREPQWGEGGKRAPIHNHPLILSIGAVAVAVCYKCIQYDVSYLFTSPAYSDWSVASSSSRRRIFLCSSIAFFFALNCLNLLASSSGCFPFMYSWNCNVDIMYIYTL